nr:hypothetical protein [uncultured Celeribacter sp.]
MQLRLKTSASKAAMIAALMMGLGSGASAQSVANVTMFGADTAFILPSGGAFVGATLTDPRGGVSGNDWDGDIALGMGFGDPITSLGFEVDLNITGVEPFMDSGAFTLKAARALALQPNHVVFASLGVGNFAAWGDADESDENWNVTVSGLTQIQGNRMIHPLMWTVGYGSDTTLSEAGSSLTEEGLFAGLGVGVTEYMGVSVSGTENQMNAGLGFKIPGLDGWGVSLGMNDITDNMDRQQKVLSISYSTLDLFGRK